MIRSVLIASLLLPALPPPAPLQDGDLKRVLENAEGVKKSARKLSKEAREKIEKALGAKLEDRDLPVIWEARAATPGAPGAEKTRVLYASVSAKGPKGVFRLGLAIVPDEARIFTVKALENKDDPALESPAFLGQFEGMEYTDALAKPPADLEKARAQAKDGKDDRSKELAAHFLMLEKMHGVGIEWGVLDAQLGKEDAGAADAAGRLKGLLKDTLAATPAFKSFLAQGSLDRFNAALKGSMADLDSLATAVRAKKYTEAGKLSHKIGGDRCSACHSWAPARFRTRRKDLGIGNGFFQVGHEIGAPAEGARDSFQAAATAIRRAVLVLSESK